MATKLKDMYLTPDSLDEFVKTIKRHYPKFKKARFLELLAEKWDDLELMARVGHASVCLHKTLPADYKTALEIIYKAAPDVKGMESMIFPDYVSRYGLDDWKLSIPALAFLTPFSTSEFAVRPYLLEDPVTVMKQMNKWAKDPNEHVRRFASEGCRPRLPWGASIPAFKEDPSLIIPVLEKLKNDKAEYVRKSVANNLNDISKDNPTIVLELCEKWYGKAAGTDWIVKHACRTLLKKGDTRAMLLFGFLDPKNIKITDFSIDVAKVKIGDSTGFTFQLNIPGKNDCKVRLEYGTDYVKANGKTSRKIFQIAEKTYKPGQYIITRKLDFQNRSTRKHYPGLHVLTIIANGQEKATAEIQLLE